MSSGFVVSGGGVCAGRPSGRVVVARRGGRRRALRVARCAVEDGGEVKGGDDRLIRPAPKRSDIVAEDEDEILLGLEDSLTEDERRVKKPNDPTELRTESERRRSNPVGEKLRRRRRQQPESEKVDWDKMETRPLVKQTPDPRTGDDYWIDLTVKKETPKRRSKPIDNKLKERLKAETAAPYKNNWIGIIVVTVLVLVILYNVLPNETPMISLPDL